MMRVMARAHIILVFISALLFVDVSARVIRIQPTTLKAAFSGTPLLEAISRLPNSKWISLVSPSSPRLQTGQTLPGASNFKLYLKILGYIKETISDPDFKTLIFSNALELGFKNFQRNYKLPETGRPDNSTVELIKRPRCGISDVINGNSTMLEDGVISFDWPWPKGKKEFTYAFSPQRKVPTSLKTAFSSAFSRWEQVTGLSFNETASFNESDIRIMFSKWKATELVAGGTLRNSTMLRWDMFFDVDEKWVLPAADGGRMIEADQLDIETAVMHQIGHLLGFGHTTKEEAAVMFPFMERGKRKLDFAEDESKRIQQVIRSDNDTSSYGGAAGGVGPGWVRLGIAFFLLLMTT